MAHGKKARGTFDCEISEYINPYGEPVAGQFEYGEDPRRLTLEKLTFKFSRCTNQYHA